MTGPAGDAVHETELAALDEALRDVAAEPGPSATGLGRRVMERVEALAGHDRFAVLPGPGGDTAVAVGVVAVVVRRAVRAVRGVADARVVVAPADAGAAVVVEVGLVADPGYPLPDLAERVRRAVAAAVTVQTGLTAARVDVDVRDLRM